VTSEVADSDGDLTDAGTDGAGVVLARLGVAVAVRVVPELAEFRAVD
jgi:hypothetical protein